MLWHDQLQQGLQVTLVTENGNELEGDVLCVSKSAVLVKLNGDTNKSFHVIPKTETRKKLKLSHGHYSSLLSSTDGCLHVDLLGKVNWTGYRVPERVIDYCYTTCKDFFWRQITRDMRARVPLAQFANIVDTTSLCNHHYDDKIDLHVSDDELRMYDTDHEVRL